MPQKIGLVPIFSFVLQMKIFLVRIQLIMSSIICPEDNCLVNVSFKYQLLKLMNGCACWSRKPGENEIIRKIILITLLVHTDVNSWVKRNRAWSRKLWQRPIFAKKCTLFEKRAPKFYHPMFNRFSKCFASK